LREQKRQENSSSNGAAGSRSFSAAQGNNNNGDEDEDDEEDGGGAGVAMDRGALQDMVSSAGRSEQLRGKTDTYKKLKQDLLRSRRAVNVVTGADAEKV
jgi:hypothetical protein